MEIYKCIEDLQSTDWYVGKVMDIEAWRETAQEWARIDDMVETIKTLQELPQNEVMDYIADIWQLSFEKISDEMEKIIDDELSVILKDIDNIISQYHHNFIDGADAITQIQLLIDFDVNDFIRETIEKNEVG